MISIPIIIFTLLYIYISNWNRVHQLVKSWQTKKSDGTTTLRMKDKELLELIHNRTGVNIGHIYLVPSDKIFAYSGGIPKKPLLFVSNAAYKIFKGDSLEWLLLHEMGHILYYHAIWITIVQLFYLGLGIYILGMFSFPLIPIIIAPILAVVLAIAAIQTNKEFDLLANQYAGAHMKNPNGMKEGAILMMKQLQDQGIKKDTLIMKLFYPWNYGLLRETLDTAEKEIEKRRINSRKTVRVTMPVS